MELRRQDRMLPREDAKQLLREGEYGILSTIGADGYPYGVPVSYTYDEEENRLIFHGVKGVGHRYENVCRASEACFTVVGRTEVLPDKFSTKYESVIVFGRVGFAEDPIPALKKLIEKYSQGFLEKGYRYAEGSWEKTAVYELRIESLTGKARKA